MRRFCLLFTVVLLGAPLFAVSNPIPFVNQPLVPSSAVPGGADFTMKVTGSGFVAGAVVKWNGIPLSTKLVNRNQLKATVPAARISKASTVIVTVANPGGGTSNAVFFSVTAPSTSLTFNASTLNVGLSPASLVAADFNNDGKTDLAVVNQNQPASCYQNHGVGTIQLLSGNGAGGFSTVSETCFPDTLGTFGLPNLAVGDFNGDGTLDLLARSNDQGLQTLSSYLGSGNGTFTFQQNALEIDVIDPVAVGDFNRDGKLDFATPGDALDFPGIFFSLGNGDGTFTYTGALGPFDMGLEASAATGDFNNDGILDLVVTDAQPPGQVLILLGNGDGTFTQAATQPATTMVSPPSVTTGDFNCDGILDLAFADSGSTALTVLLGNGDGTFTQKAGQPDAGQTTTYIASADFNGDGKLDLALVDSANAVLIYLGNGDGTFQTALEAMAGNGASQLAIGDFNGDGRLDLAITNSSDNTVSLLIQSPAATVSTSSLKFGKQAVGTTSAARRVTLTNSGSAALKLSSVIASGDFAETNNCKAILPIGQACSINVVFKPTAKGNRTGNVTITDNAASSPQIIQLSGFGN